MKESVIKNILVNFRAFFTINLRRSINENRNRTMKVEEDVAGMTSHFHYLNLLDYYARHESEKGPYMNELEYLQKAGHYCVFPYDFDCVVNSIHAESGFDSVAKLPYVVHNQKKLYFKADCTKEGALDSYKYLVGVERLLGDGEGEEAPHQYQSPRVHVAEGDMVFDIGAAEGLFALDHVDKASHVVIVESDPEWMEPLRHTFAPYGDKVTLLQKYVSATDTENTVSLGKLLSEFDYESAFVKVDIEGCEVPSLTSAESVLRQKPTKFAVASYHKQHDAEELKAFFDRLGYYSEFSKNYMLFHLYDTPVPPYFRHGIVRAKGI